MAEAGLAGSLALAPAPEVQEVELEAGGGPEASLQRAEAPPAQEVGSPALAAAPLAGPGPDASMQELSDSPGSGGGLWQQQSMHLHGGASADIIEMPEGLPGTANMPGPKYKRGRGRSFFKEQPKKGAVCQVPGCDRSLHKLRDYYKRYKICPYHLELPCLVVEGQTIRFCQQCGRFQLLTDFEGDRRSCRRKLDKHNERRRKAEAEQKARMADSGSDSPGSGSGRGPKAHRVSPWHGGGGGKGYANHSALMGVPGGGYGGYAPGPAGDLGDRLRQLAADPGLRDLPPALLQTLADPAIGGGTAGVDWLAAGTLGSMGGQAPPPPQQQASPMLPPEVLALLPPDLQQQVMQQGTGVLDSTLVGQLQQLQQQQPQPQPQPQRGFTGFGGLFGSGGTLPQQQQQQQQVPFSAPLPASRPGSSVQHLLFPQQQQHRGQGGPPPGGAPTSVFMQQRQAPPPAVPLLLSEPAAPPPEPAASPAAAALAAASDGSEKAALLVALAKSVGVSADELSRALQQGGGPAAPAAAPVPPPPAQHPPAPPAPQQYHPHPHPAPGMAPPRMGDARQVSPMRPEVSRPGSGVAAASPSPARAAAAPPSTGSQSLDLDQLQRAMQGAGLNAGFASDASLLLQLVAAVEAAQQRTQPHTSSDRMHNLSLKLFNCTPEQLPPNILEQLGQWMAQNGALLEGATRPGCVQVSLSALLSGADADALSASFAGVVQQLAAQGLGGVRTSILGQLDGQATLVDAGGAAQLAHLSLGGCAAVAPDICSVRPLAVTPAYAGPILVTGRNIGGQGDSVFCRTGGSFPVTEVLGRGKLLCGGKGEASDQGWVLLRLPALRQGCVQVEAQRGMFLSQPQPFLVVDDAAAVAELRQLEGPAYSPAATAELLLRLGAVLRFAAQHAGGQGAHPAHVARVAAAAQELSAMCILRRWAAVLRLVLPAACLGSTAERTVAGIEAQLGGIPLLHAAALVGSAETVHSLGAWAEQAGVRLPLGARWGGGLTALHVATLLREPEDVALALTDLCRDTAPGVWASACAVHGEETPLGLACRMDKRGLLAALAGHGVPAAGAMLAALCLQDGGTCGLEAALPLGVEDADEEQSMQHREWLKLMGAQADAPVPPAATKQAACEPGTPSRVPCAAGDRCMACSDYGAAAAKHHHGFLARCSADSCDSDAEAEPAAEAEQLSKGYPKPAPPAASFYLPFGAAELPHRERARVFKEGSPLWAFQDTATERRFRTWHSAKLAKLDVAVCALVALLCCLLITAAPTVTRQHLHLWLFTTMARGPLMLQPLLLLCPPARAAIRQCRDGILLGLHIIACAAQFWPGCAPAADWLAGSHAMLAHHPAGLCLLLAVFTLQLRFALQVPALTLIFAAHALLLPAACQQPMAIAASGGVRLFAVAVGLPLLAVGVMEARARSTFAVLHRAES